MATLYELTAEYKELLDMAEEQNLTQAGYQRHFGRNGL